MVYQELLILLPCHSLEDFPTHHEGDDAANLLASWSVLWHPQLITAAQKAPVWGRVDDAPHDVSHKLIAIPNIAKERLPTGFVQRAKEAGAILLRNHTQRAPLLVAALEPLGGETVQADLAADFMALGYAYLQIQLLTRQMRYSSNLDETYFNEQLLLAANACVAGDEPASRERLGACFSLLAEERDRYYPVEAHIIDLTMVAESTLGASLRSELASTAPNNLLLNAELLEKLAMQEPVTLNLLKQAWSEQRVSLLGGEMGETRFPLLALEDVRRSLAVGGETYERLLGKRPTIYGRRRFGLTPALPSILRRFGFRGALHATLEEGKFPEGTQLKASWEGRDGTTLEAIAKPPLDASQAKTFLQFSTKLGESMDHDHVATILLAHWPGQAAESLDDIRRTAKYANCLGKLITCDEYFSQTATPGQLDRFEADRYKSPYLKQSVIRKQSNPISSVAQYWKRRAQWEAVETCHTLVTLVSGTQQQSLPPLDQEIYQAAEGAIANELDSTLTALQRAQVESLAAKICASSRSEAGVLVINPYACVRRVGCDALDLVHVPAPEKPLYAVAEQDNRKQAVVDVPGHGFAWIPSAKQAYVAPRQTPLMVEGTNCIRNEFFEAVINPVTGALQSVHTYKSRRNRLSQQLALRTPGPPSKPGDVYRDPDETAQYSVMACDAMSISCDTVACGEITAVGRLLDLQGTTQATFRQRFQVWRGSRVLKIAIELEPMIELKSDPCTSYFASRFAWGEEAVDVARSVHEQYHNTTAKNMEAPHYIEVSHVEERTTLLTGGLPYHRRVAPAVIDSLLIVKGETARQFEIGFGIDLPYPLHEAKAVLAPPLAIPVSHAPTQAGGTGWLLHVDCRNVVTTHLVPMLEHDKAIGFRVRLMEIAGRSVEPTLSAMRAVRSAKIVDFCGQTVRDCAIMQGNVKFKMSSHEWVELEAYW
jgi:alpha-mannosidase